MIRVAAVFSRHSMFIAVAILGVAESPQVCADHRTTLNISGTPATTATVGTAYSFTPAVNPPAGQVRYFIRNKPSWATFDNTTGHVGGTPTAAGTFSNIYIAAAWVNLQSVLPGFTITVKSGKPNSKPTISGTAPTSVTAGDSYSFTPTASDANQDKLTFSVQKRPSWASFNTTTGTLAGKPAAADVGTYPNIVISVSDGSSSASLNPFSIAVDQTSNGSAQLSWNPPTQNTNGTSLTNLAGYRIYYGTSKTDLSKTIQVTNPGLSNYVISNLSAGTWYFDVVAYNAAGTQSAASLIGSKTIK